MFTVGAAGSALLIYGSLAAAAPALHFLGFVLLVADSIYVLLWHIRGWRWIRFGRLNIQARQDLAARGWPGALYFGAALGPGVLTTLGTPLVTLGALACLTLGGAWALSFGLGFALGRSSLTWVAATGMLDRLGAHRIALALTRRSPKRRLAGVAVTSGLLLSAMLHNPSAWRL